LVRRNNSYKIACLGATADDQNLIASFGLGGTTRTPSHDANAVIIVNRGATQNGINFELDNVCKVRIDSSGAMGIGTPNPSQQLEVVGNALLKGTDGWSQVGHEARLYLGDTNHYIKAIFGDGVRIGTWAVPDAITLKQDTGRVGINNTDPGSKFVVKGSGNNSTTSSLNVTDSDGNSKLFVRDDGNIGVGEPNPSSKLDVAGDIEVSNGSSLKNSSGNQKITMANTAGGIELYSISEVHVNIDTNDGGSDKFTVNYGSAKTCALFVGSSYYNGAVGINNTNPQEKLDVEGKIRVGTGTYKANIEAGSGSPTHQAPKGTLYINTTASSATTRLYINKTGGSGASAWASFTASS
jgi:hypothetical protein